MVRVTHVSPRGCACGADLRRRALMELLGEIHEARAQHDGHLGAAHRRLHEVGGDADAVPVLQADAGTGTETAGAAAHSSGGGDGR